MNHESLSYLEWPKDAETRLKLMNSIATDILAESRYESERNKTISERCVNIFPKGSCNSTRDRVAAIWTLRNGAIHFLVKRFLYEEINSRVIASGIKEATLKKSEYVYEFISLENATKILEIMSKQ